MNLLAIHNPQDALSGNLRGHLLDESERGEDIRLVEDPRAAEVILFFDSYTDTDYHFIRRHPHFRMYPAKCFLFSQLDNPVFVLPGIYASLDRQHHDPRWTDSFCYIDGYRRNRFLESAREGRGDRSLLFSFLGRNSHPVRERLFATHFQRKDVVVEDTSRFDLWSDESERKCTHERRYAEIGATSKFMLCPRGAGVASIRLFEAMQLGCVPVIVSDDWVPPVGPDWDRFSLRVPERAVETAERLVSKREPLAKEMGVLARREWEKWFREKNHLRQILERIGRLTPNSRALRLKRLLMIKRQFAHRRLLMLRMRAAGAFRRIRHSSNR